MSNATKFLLAALVALFVTVTVSVANGAPPLPGQWFIMGKIAGSPPDTFDYYTEKFFPTEAECATFMLTDPDVQKDLKQYTEGVFKEYPGASLTITCAQALPAGPVEKDA